MIAYVTLFGICVSVEQLSFTDITMKGRDFMKKTQFKNSLLLLLTATIWGTAFVAQSAGSGMGAYSFLAGRSWLAVLVLLPTVRAFDAFHRRHGAACGWPKAPADRRLLLTAGLAVFTGNALSRDVVRVELVGSRNAPAVVISRNESAVILFRGGDVTRCAVETTLERRNIRTVECLIDLRLRPRSAQRMGAEQRIAVDRMALYATRRVRCGPAEVEVLRTRNGCVARIHAAGQTFVTLSGSAALAAPVQADYLLASPARPDCVKYGAILSLSSDYRWMPEALSSGQLCHSFSRAE